MTVEQLKEALEIVIKSHPYVTEYGYTIPTIKEDVALKTILDFVQSYLSATKEFEIEDWRGEFQYLLDRKILSRDELAYLFGQIKSIVDNTLALCKIAHLKKMEAVKQKIMNIDNSYLHPGKRKELVEALELINLKSLPTVEEIEEAVQNALEKSITEDKTVYNEEQLFELLGRTKLVENITQSIHSLLTNHKAE